MANTRTFSAASQSSAVIGRHRLRAVERYEGARTGGALGRTPGRALDVGDFLPPGATWLPAPEHTLPALPGRPPMVGYLVLVPADQQPAVAPVVEKATEEAAEEEGAGARGDGPVRIDGAGRTAAVDGRTLDLTYLEFELLAHLVAHPHRVHTRDQLVSTVWGYGHVGDGRTVDVHIARLRRKLGAEHRGRIQTVRRVGYKFTP